MEKIQRRNLLSNPQEHGGGVSWLSAYLFSRLELDETGWWQDSFLVVGLGAQQHDSVSGVWPAVQLELNEKTSLA